MRTIVFLDLVCPKPYDLSTLMTEPLGGSEATMVRIAQGLVDKDYKVVVAQHNRTEDSDHAGVQYRSFDVLDTLTNVHAAIAFRSANTIPYIQKRWPDAKRFVWCQDFCQEQLVNDAEILRGTRILCVSRTHKTITASALMSQLSDTKGITVDFIYNPIDEDLKPDNTVMYSSRYVFFSSPHKGLERTLEVFTRLREFDHNAELLVANPGYLPDHGSWPEGVTNLGPLPHHEVIKRVRTAQCVLNLNDVFPETFGIVFSEASAVGTPTLTAGVGASREILGDREQIVDVQDTKAVIERLTKWQTQRPVVKANEEFRLSNVLKRWGALLS